VQGWQALIKLATHWVLPPGILEYLRSHLLAKSLTQEERAIMRKNRVLNNRHAEERCFILATGPSIKKQDLKLLRGETCIALSNLFVHPDYKFIEPSYHCVAGYHKPIPKRGWAEWLGQMESATDNASMFFSLADREDIERKGLFSKRVIHYLQYGNLSEIPRGELDITRCLPNPQSVTIMALEVALYMGFKNIYLLGCDHDWLLHLGTSQHFYEENQHALVRAGYDEWDGVDLGVQCQKYVRLWQQYRALWQIARRKSINIFNATEGGLLDVFPRKSYKSLFAE
jgi:hypothetical protein